METFENTFNYALKTPRRAYGTIITLMFCYKNMDDCEMVVAEKPSGEELLYLPYNISSRYQFAIKGEAGEILDMLTLEEAIALWNK